MIAVVEFLGDLLLHVHFYRVKSWKKFMQNE